VTAEHARGPGAHAMGVDGRISRNSLGHGECFKFRGARRKEACWWGTALPPPYNKSCLPDFAKNAVGFTNLRGTRHQNLRGARLQNYPMPYVLCAWGTAPKLLNATSTAGAGPAWSTAVVEWGGGGGKLMLHVPGGWVPRTSGARRW
jgi:hypothetical protein